MAVQTAGNIMVAISRESTEGTVATATGAYQLRITDSPGLELVRGDIRSAEKRGDGDKSMGRLGLKMVRGSFNGELSAGGAWDVLLEAASRSAWQVAAATTFASMTTVAIGTNTLTAAAGVWDTQGIRTGDIITLTNTAANNNLRTPVVSVTTLVITTPTGSYTTATATTSGTVTRLKKVVSATTPTKYSHSIEQVDEDIDGSEIFLGCALIGLKFSFRSNQPVQVVATFEGINRTTATGASSPYFTSPSVTTNLPLIAADSTIRYNSALVTTFTGLDIDIQIAGAGAEVIGSLTSPSIFLNDRTVSVSITSLRSDFANIALFDAETEFEIGCLLQELESVPKSCVNFFLPRCKIKQLSAPVGGGDGPKVETLTVEVAPKDAATGYDGTIMNIASSE